MKTTALLFIGALLLSGCKTVSVLISEDGEPTRRVTVPFSLVKGAIYLSDEDEFVLEDLGGVNSSIDLHALAKALHEDADRVQIDLKQDGTSFSARKIGRVFQVTIDDDVEESQITLNLPLTLVSALEKNDFQKVDTRAMMRALTRYRGVLVEIDSPYEKVRIKLN